MILAELAIKVGDLRKQADEWATNQEEHLKDSKHIGDIDSFELKQKNSIISAWDGGKLIAIVRIDNIPNVYTVVDDLWVREDYVGKKIISKMLWFLKSRLGYKKLLLGKIHSTDTYSLLKANGLSKFKKYWFDIMTWNTEPFDPSTMDDFYSADKSKWSLMLESQNDGLDNLPLFNEDAGFVTQSYDWQIE